MVSDEGFICDYFLAVNALSLNVESETFAVERPFPPVDSALSLPIASAMTGYG